TIGSYISKIIVDPSNSNSVYCSGRDGVFRSTDAGATWTRTLILNTTSLNMSPTNFQTIYAASGRDSSVIYKSTDGAVSWTQINNGVPKTGRRTQLAISP